MFVAEDLMYTIISMNQQIEIYIILLFFFNRLFFRNIYFDNDELYTIDELFDM